MTVVAPADHGLCNSCKYAQRVESDRHSIFILCRRAFFDPEHFLRYPPLPVIDCAGYEKAEAKKRE